MFQRPRAQFHLAALMLIAVLFGCASEDPSGGLIASFPLDRRGDVPDPAVDVVLDPAETSDGGGSLLVPADRKRKAVFASTELGKVHGDSLTLTGRCRVAMVSEQVVWRVMLEEGDGDVRIFSAGYYPRNMSLDWHDFQVGFPLGNVEDPVRVSLAVVLSSGKIWIDDVRLWDGEPASEDVR